MLRRRIKYTLSKFLATHPNYYEIPSKLSRLRNFSIKDGLKIVSKTKMKNCWSMIDQGLHCA